MVVVNDWIAAARQNVADLSRARHIPQTPPVWAKLMKVVSKSLIATQDYRYLYIVREMVVSGSTPYAAGTNSNAPTYDAISVSELSNGSNPAVGHYSYGVDKVNLSGTGFLPVAIPDDTLVLCVPHRKSDGNLIWLIVNTQAIDGVCEAPAALSGGVTSVDGGYGLTGGPITSTGTLALSLTQQSAFLGADVTMTNANTWYDGPSLSLAAGTWLLFASANVGRTATTAGNYDLRISTGSTHYASVQQYHASAANNWAALSCNGVAVLAATTTIKIQVAGTLTNDVLKAATPNNASGSNATGLIALRIA